MELLGTRATSRIAEREEEGSRGAGRDDCGVCSGQVLL